MKNQSSIIRAVTTAVLAIGLPGVVLRAQERAIYPEKADARASIKQAIGRAAHAHKRVILDFGGNWCGDCKVLDGYFHKEPSASLLKHNYILVDVNIGNFDMNKDIARQYGVPLEKGVPALAVLDSHGHAIYSQKNGEFESMRAMDANSVTDFLKRWKG